MLLHVTANHMKIDERKGIGSLPYPQDILSIAGQNIRKLCSTLQMPHYGQP
jgi:hypothetical protein